MGFHAWRSSTAGPRTSSNYSIATDIGFTDTGAGGPQKFYRVQVVTS